MNKFGKFLIGVVVVGALGTAAFFRLNKEEEPLEAVPNPTVQVQNPAPGTIELSTELTGTVEASDVVYAIAMGSGEVTEVFVKQGDTVEKDQVLFKIDNKQLDAARIQMNTAKVSLDDAQTNLNRMKVLYESGDISAQAYEQTVNGVSMARLQYDAAKLSYDIQLENSSVTAPIGGLLESFDVEVHDMMSAGTMAGVISGAGSKSLSFAVSERVQKGLSVGTPITVEKNGSEYEGVITEIGTMVDQMTGLFKVKASMSEAEALANGTIVKLSVIANRVENVMTVPVDCVSYSNGKSYVHTYDPAAGVAHRVYIEGGLIGADTMEVKSGLSFEDQVITTWSKELYEGAPVNLAADDGEEAVKKTDGPAAEDGNEEAGDGAAEAVEPAEDGSGDPEENSETEAAKQ